jgi:hypothetical protein
MKKTETQTKFKVGDKVTYKIPMYDSYIHCGGKITKLFKNGKVRIEYYTWTGALCKSNVEANEITLKI